MGSRLPALLTLLLLLTAPSAGVAQFRPVAWHRWEPPASAADQQVPQRRAFTPPITGESPPLMLGGILGGAAGLLGGGLAGYHLGGGGRLCGDDSCGLYAGVLGAVAGEMALLPLGVHLANHSHGNYGYSLLASVAIGVVGTSAAAKHESGLVLLAVPIVQIVSSILIERATSRE